MATVHVRSGHVQPIWAGHPWVFAQAVERVEGAPAPGQEVRVVDPRGRFLGRGFWSPRSAIPVRILERDPRVDALDHAWFGRRIEAAARWRAEVLGLPGEETTGYRLVHAEGDGLAGLVVDVYGDVAAVQLLTLGMKQREDDVFAHVARVTGVRSIVEVPSPHGQRIEGFEVELGVVRGPDVQELHFRERGFEFRIPLSLAQKTGYYFDQRENRALCERLARGRRVLDAFCYVGGFSLAAARGGAREVVALDASADIVTLAAGHVHAHGYGERVKVARADLRRALRQMAQEGERFDLVVADPPKLAPSSRHLPRGRQAYRRLNAAAVSLLAPGGLLLTCSCSAAMDAATFQRTVALAARDAGRQVVLLQEGSQGPDHPVPLAFPDGRYLKCLLARVVD